MKNVKIYIYFEKNFINKKDVIKMPIFLYELFNWMLKYGDEDNSDIRIRGGYLLYTDIHSMIWNWLVAKAERKFKTKNLAISWISGGDIPEVGFEESEN
jgi:hypothetical protein